MWVLYQTWIVGFLRLDDFMIGIQESKLVALHKAKQPYYDKVHWQIMEFV